MKWYAGVLVVVCLQVACSKSPRTYLERGSRLESAGKYADAKIEYRKSVLKDPKFAEGYYRLGLLEYKLHDGFNALEDFERAAGYDRGNDKYAIEVANLCIEAFQAWPARRHFYEQAADEADLLLKKNPKSFDGLRLRGDILVIDRKYDDALVELRKAYAIQPNDPSVNLAMAQILFTENQDRQGEDLLRHFLAVRPDVPAVYDLLEKRYARAQRWVDAEDLLKSEITSLPGDARPRLELAAVYRSSGRYPEMSHTLQAMLNDRANFPTGPALVGDFYAGSHNWDDALTQYRAGIQQSPKQAFYHQKIAQALAALGKHEEAIGELNKFLKDNPKDSGARLTRAVLLRESQNSKERNLAIQALKELAAQDPQNQVVRYNLGVSYLDQGDTASAWQELKKSSDLGKDYIAPRLLLGDIAQTAHNYPLALEASGEVLALDPDNLDAKLLRAAALVGNKSYREADNELDALSRLQPNSKEVGLQQAALAAAEKDYGKAEALYRRFYQQGSSDLRPLQGLLQLCVLEHHPEKAQALLEDDLKQEPNSSPVRLLLASVATGEGKFDLASEQYRWLESKDPKSAQVYSALGDLYQRRGDAQNALASYEKARELAPNDAKILNAIAILESDSGQAQQAIETLNKQLALDPKNAVAMNNLAFNLAESGQNLDRAMSLVQTVAREFPNEPGVLDTLGWVYAKRGLNQSAIQVLSGLVKKYPNQPAFRYHLAFALLRNKQTSDAKQELLAALSQHPPKELSNKIQENLAQIR